MNGYLTYLPEHHSRLVTLKAFTVFAQNGLNISETMPITVRIPCATEWKYVKVVLQSIDGSENELPLGMADKEAKRMELINIFQALQIQDLHCTNRFVDALCMGSHFPARISDHITYLKM